MTNRSQVKLEGVVDNVIVSLNSWEYHVDFIVIQPKYNLGGHTLILGRPWLAIVDSLISYRSGNMIISRGSENKKVTLYPPARSITELEQMSWLEETNSKEETFHSFCSITTTIYFKEENDENVLNHFISNPDSIEKFKYS